MWSTHNAIGVVSAAVGFIPTLIHIPHQDITNCRSHAYHFLCVFSNLLGWSSDSMAQVSLWKKLFRLWETLIFLNSSLNPVIYCWRMRHIRRGIIDVLWNLSRERHPSRCIYNRSSNVVLANNWTLAWDLHELCAICFQWVKGDKPKIIYP